MCANHDSRDYKQTERLHYERIAQLHSEEMSEYGIRTGPELLHPALRAPYLDFAEAVRRLAGPGAVVVDIAAGTGVHSFAAEPNATIVATDISEGSLALARRRSEAAGRPLLLVAADGDSLPLGDSVADAATCAGSLYCFEFATLLREVRRVLKPNGAWVIVDSYAHNPIYRANRFVGYLRGRRTKRALGNIPSRATVRLLRGGFYDVSIRYYGFFSFLSPFLSKMIGSGRSGAFLDRVDRRMQWAGILAFKIVIIARNPR